MQWFFNSLLDISNLFFLNKLKKPINYPLIFIPTRSRTTNLIMKKADSKDKGNCQ